MLANLIEIGENEDIQVDELVWEEHKILLERHEQNVYVRWIDFNGAGMFNQELGHDVDFTEIQLNLGADGLPVNLNDLFQNLAGNNPANVGGQIQGILQHIAQVYNQYNQALNFGHNRKSDYHGFLLGFLINFRHTNHQARVYQELFMGEGYADIALLVRGQNNIINSVPVIIELGIGGANVALETAHTRVNRCPISSLSLHTTSQNAVCVGLNFNTNPGFIIDVEHFLQEELSLMEILCGAILESPDFQQNIARNISNYLRFPSFGKPVSQGQFLDENNRRFNYITSFTCGNAAFADDTAQVGDNNQIHVTKYLVQYEEGINNAVSTIVLNADFVGQNGAIVFHIRNVLDYNMFPGLCLQLGALQLQPQDRVYEVMCQLNPNIEVNDLPRVGDPNLVNFQIVSVEAFDYDLYLQRYNNQFFPGNLLQVNDVGNLRDIAGRMMNNNWTNIVAHGELMQGISRVLSPLRFIMNRNDAHGDGFHAVLHGAFRACIHPNKVIVEFQVGGGSRVDLLLARNPALVAQGLNNMIDTQLIAIEVKFAMNNADLGNKRSEARRQIERYGSCNGYARVSDGNQVALFYAVFNNAEQQDNPDTLILYPNAMSVYPINRGAQM